LTIVTGGCRRFGASLHHIPLNTNFMQWYNYLAAFGAGAFLANFVPHFMYGISGNKFPTPFANPGGIGLSSATVNVVWALFNLLIGYLLCTLSYLDSEHPASLLLFFAGISVLGIFGSVHFQKKHKE
jgi:hypothetical protein